MATGLLRRAATLLGMIVPWRDPKIPDLVQLTSAAKMLGRNRNVVLYWAKNRKIMSARTSTGEWVFRLDHIEEVTRLLVDTGGNIDEVSWILRERARQEPGPE